MLECKAAAPTAYTRTNTLTHCNPQPLLTNPQPLTSTSLLTRAAPELGSGRRSSPAPSALGTIVPPFTKEGVLLKRPLPPPLP